MSSNQPLLSTLKSSPSIMWLAHTLEVTALLAGVTGGIAVYEATATGNYDLSSLGGIFLSAVIAILSKAIATLINNAQFGQALNDLAHIGGGVIQSPLVVVHASQPVVSSVQAPTVPVVSQPVQNIPAQVQVSQPNPVSNQPIQNQATSAQTIQPQAVQRPPLDNVAMVNTLPTIQAIGK